MGSCVRVQRIKQATRVHATRSKVNRPVVTYGRRPGSANNRKLPFLSPVRVERIHLVRASNINHTVSSDCRRISQSATGLELPKPVVPLRVHLDTGSSRSRDSYGV